MAIAEIASENGGSITGAELRGLGLTSRRIEFLVAIGYLHRTRRDHFLVGHLAPSVRGDRHAKVRQAGAGAHLSSLAAIDHWGFLPWDTRTVDIVVPKRRRLVHGARLSIRPRLIELGGTTYEGTSVLKPEFAVFSACEHVNGSSIRRIIREGRYRKRLTLPALERVAALSSLPGVRRFRAELERWKSGDGGHDSHFELLVDQRLAPDVIHGSLANAELWIGGELIRPDRVWLRERIALESYGPPHDEPDQQRLDRMRVAALVADGFDVYIVHWLDFERAPAAAVAPVEAAVRRARASGSRAPTAGPRRGT